MAFRRKSKLMLKKLVLLLLYTGFVVKVTFIVKGAIDNMVEYNTRQQLAKLSTMLLNESVPSRNLMPQDQQQQLNTPDTKTKESVEMDRRRNVVRRVCSAHPELKSDVPPLTYVSPKHQFSYCPVAKVACTFWTRFMYQLIHTDPMESPFDITIEKGFTLQGKEFFKKEAQSSKTRFLELVNAMTNFVFVRDPLSRVFSAYVDKIFAPNPPKWKNWALQAVRKARNTKKYIRNCGKDVTFSEFVSHVTRQLVFRDVHFFPSHRQCSPCAVNFSIIGKMESANEDTHYVLKTLGIDENQIHLDRMDDDAATFALRDSSEDPLSKTWLEMGCAGKEEVLRRILRKLQIRGFISWRFKYRLSKQEAMNMTFDKFHSILTSARKEYNNKTELSIQKKQASKEAFHTLTQEQFEKFREVYKLDVLLFDYEDNFRQVAEIRKQTFIQTNAFDYEKDWDLSAVL